MTDLMNSLALHFSHKRDFSNLFFQDGELDCFFIPTVLEVKTGEAVDLTLNFDDEAIEFKLGADVLWRRVKGQARPFLRPGTCIAFPKTELEKLDRVLAYADNQEIDFVKRSAPRIPVAVDVKYKSNKVTITDSSRDLSMRGMFLFTNHPFLIGDRLQIRMRVPGKILPLNVRCEVVRKEKEGVGLNFLFEKDAEQQHIRRLILQANRKNNPQMIHISIAAGESAEGITLTHTKTPPRMRRPLPVRRRRPELLASKFISRKVAGHQSVTQLDLGLQGVWAWRFETNNSSIWVMWYEDENLPVPKRRHTKIMVRLPFEGRRALISRQPDKDDIEPVKTYVDTSNGSILMTLDNTPVVVERLA